jgi:hypothetical protein
MPLPRTVPESCDDKNLHSVLSWKSQIVGTAHLASKKDVGSRDFREALHLTPDSQIMKVPSLPLNSEFQIEDKGRHTDNISAYLHFSTGPSDKQFKQKQQIKKY